MRVETVTICNDAAPSGVTNIRAADFDSDTHTLAGVIDIDAMKRAEVIECLEAHGIDKPTGKLSELRAKLRNIMFVGI